MNKKNLIITSTKNMDRNDWLNFRKPLHHVSHQLKQWEVSSYESAQGFFDDEVWKDYIFPCVGGSEVSTVMGLNPYKASITLFYEKVGVKEPEDIDNAAMFWGRELEEQVAQKWQYWPGDAEGMMQNFKDGRKLRKCERVNAYLQHKDFPWLFCSLDRIIKKWGDSKHTGILECKTMSGWVAKMWENGLPPDYLVQAQTQMLICEESFGEIAYLMDGRSYDVLPFEFSYNIADAVKARTKIFFDTVKTGIENFVLANFAMEQDLRMEHLHVIDMLAPEPDGSEAYKDYLSQHYQDKDFGKPGGQYEFNQAEIYDDCNHEMKLIGNKQTEASNKLKAFMGDANKIDFGEKGNVTWKQNAKGTRTFRVSIKRDQKEAYKETEKILHIA